MNQSIRPSPQSHLGGCDYRDDRAIRASGWMIVLVGVGLGCFGVPLTAQSRATLQVAAEVVQVTPTAAALGQARDLAAQAVPGRGVTPLATITVVSDGLAADPERRPAARVVTIEFLSN